MRPVLHILRLLLTSAPGAMARGAALSVLVLLMGAALLGLSGWFVTATGLAGLGGIGIAFDVFRPSAGVRFLALGRTAARYGERLLTHDATLRALAALRVDLLRRLARLDGRALSRLRGEQVLTRIVADVDALDGLVLRLLLPGTAALAAHLLIFAALAWLLGWPVALAILAGTLPAAALILWRLARRGLRPSTDAENEAQALRRGLIDTIRDREAVILSGRLSEQEERLLAHDAAARGAMAALDRAERDAGRALSLLVALVAAAALVAGGWLLSRGVLDPAKAAIGFFVAVALAEAVWPLRRGVADLGRMVGAARLLAPAPDAAPRPAPVASNPDAPLLRIAVPGLDLTLAPGEAVALTGPSGAGKTELLLRIAGLGPGQGLELYGKHPDRWQEDALRSVVSMLPQRSALVAGTFRDNLSLNGEADEDTLWAALEAVALADVVRERGGLEARLGEAGAGLSGGQARRLALARNLLKKPALLLLDEPTEGLDAATADKVLRGLRAFLPRATIIAAMHRGATHEIFNRTATLGVSPAALSQGESSLVLR
ncbi:amino acid ABC transporter ATP-binding/permease protein [Albibacillus kandeliae]|uniref:amino acid ABC transporter ATP-binding/permease protein n=1 Tax=Albibacillus kandeliae TaxID=2174228 RepID=UPI000D693A27|nr:ATP-binding cassette domain-containing protein [Albibacillus kandeliae]